MTTKLLIFGITGDLSRRKLIPALEQITVTGNFDDLEVIGVSRREVDEKLLIRDERLAARTRVITMDVANPSEYERLKTEINMTENDQLLIYLSVPPSSSGQIVQLLGRAGINDDRVKLMLEKPFGTDLESAKHMSSQISEYFDDEQVYRIDHYLAKEMAQNIVAFRAHNALFAHVWDNSAIEKIEIKAYESIDIEGRTQFYEQTGALRDIVQGHLMQLLSLVIMDIPGDMHWSQVALHRLGALKSLRPADVTSTVRAQYAGYQDEVENPGSTTETFVSVRLESDAPKWTGVPFYLTTGKALDQKLTEIKVYFKKFHDAQTNCLIFRIQPEEGIEIALNTLKPDYEYEYEETRLSFNYPAGVVLPDAYEQVIVDAIRGHKHIFTSNDEVVRSWEVLQPLVSHWAMRDGCEYMYEKGSSAEQILADADAACKKE
ncbi:MAG: Glucose-6-phosphate 1-dehydrogenase [Candidatus Saccharibacteria bacterium GW2011_GWC2_48_9]|nr:MAG: Glucose-6-phosphate 1-dehydrogenase [Candidatus Saccharibacteria bacterium GW2011_GWC2_48_9]HCH34045.1 hypothetical protein [Candidatus Saccharibacteria bacterium]